MNADAPIDLAALGVRRAGAAAGVRELLRDTMERAEDGSAMAAAVVLVSADGSVASAYVIGDRWAELVGGTATLQHCLVTHKGKP